MTRTEEITAPAAPATWRHYLELTKPRLSFMSVITAMVGYLAALPYWDWVRTCYVMLGTALCAGGVAALNQWMESELDAKMQRTADRPIPTGVIQPGSAFIVGWLMCIAGLAVLFRLVNGMSAFLALGTIVAYLAIYTPAKKWSRWNTEIGAISGALPPMIGWAAAGRSNDPLGWSLFAILYCWQMPHFFALCWTYRKDYAAAGVPMLPVVKGVPETTRQIALYTILMVAISLILFAVARMGAIYLAAAVALGAMFLWQAFTLWRRGTSEEMSTAGAIRLYKFSISYLTLLFAAVAVGQFLPLR